MQMLRNIHLAALAGLALASCAAADVVGSVVSATGSVVGGVASATGSVVGGAADVATGGDED